MRRWKAGKERNERGRMVRKDERHKEKKGRMEG